MKQWMTLALAVMKQYGKTKKKKVSKTERYFKYIKYFWYTLDTSAWKNYLEYNYKQGKDNYKIRFYLDKKDTVTAITYIKNLNKFYNYPNKERKSGLSFKAPSGKKITTKTIGGKKVYIIPKGTKIYMNQKKANVSYSDFAISQCDTKGKIIAHSELEGINVECRSRSIEEYLKGVSLWDAEKDEPIRQKSGQVKPINIKKLGSYRYFVIYCFGYEYVDEEKLAPQIIYFRYKK